MDLEKKIAMSLLYYFGEKIYFIFWLFENAPCDAIGRINFEDLDDKSKEELRSMASELISKIKNDIKL